MSFNLLILSDVFDLASFALLLASFALLLAADVAPSTLLLPFVVLSFALSLASFALSLASFALSLASFDLSLAADVTLSTLPLAVDLASLVFWSLIDLAFSKVLNASFENIENPSPSFSFIISIIKEPGFLNKASNLSICGISFETISTTKDRNTLVAPKA